ncbi:HAD family hydrolase [bacterium]|nr:HAD family hydrolase [bacterium]
MNIKAIFFDIDNTLNHVQEKRFLKAYLYEAGKAFSDIMPPEAFAERQMTVAAGYVTNDGSRPISEFFKQEFSRGLPCSGDELWNRMSGFFCASFSKFKSLFLPHEGAVDTIRKLCSTDTRLVAASNPVWPKDVQALRLKWAGLDPDIFAYITGAENSRYVKPRPEYYLEICRAIGMKPSECLMVGDDPVNDGISKVTGMAFYLVVNDKSDNEKEISGFLREACDLEIPEPDQTGPLNELTGFIERIKDAER